MKFIDVLKQRLVALKGDESFTTDNVSELTGDKPVGELLSIEEVDNLLRFIIANNKLNQTLPLVEAMLTALIHNKRINYSGLEPFFNVYLKHGLVDSIVSLHKVYLSLNSATATNLFNFAYYLDKQGQYEQSISTYKESLAKGISGAEEVHLNIAKIYAESLQDTDNAREHLDKALKLKPNYVSAILNLANLEAALGNLEQSQILYEKVLSIEPHNSLALARILDMDASETNAKRVIEACKVVNDPQSVLDLQFSLARCYDSRGEYSDASIFLSKANNTLKKHYPKYDRDKQELLVTNLIELTERSSKNKPLGFEQEAINQQPLFVCGMFRSGSTLIEKILSTHSTVSSAGEMPFFPNQFGNNVFKFAERFASMSQSELKNVLNAHQALLKQQTSQDADNSSLTRTFMIDKRPDNIFYIPLIKTLYPQAKVIITARDIRDITVSILFQQLGPAFSYANSVEDIKHYFEQMNRLIDGYKSAYGADLFFVNYEDVVGNFESTVTECLAFLGLEYEPQCELFYKTKETSFTASMEQIRSPLYDKSVGRWKNYVSLFGNDLD